MNIQLVWPIFDTLTYHQGLFKYDVCEMCFPRHFFLVAADAFSWSFCGFLNVSTVSILLSVNKMMLSSLDKYIFLQLAYLLGFVQLILLSRANLKMKYFTRWCSNAFKVW